MKKYILIAGVNGAGKSTLFHVLDELKNMPRVNTDDIVKKIGEWNNASDVFNAGKQAVKMIDKYFSEGIIKKQHCAEITFWKTLRKQKC